MNAVSGFVAKLALLFRRKRFDSELDEEMAFHRAQAEKEFVAEGMTPEAARYAAMRQLGNATLLREQSHGVVAFRAESIVQDLRFALRQLRLNAGFAITAIFVLALGMGVSVAIFGFVDSALLQPLPFAAPNRLMSVDERSAMFPRSNLSRDDYDDWKRLNKSFSSIDVYNGTGYLLRAASGTEPVPAARVSDGFFRTLGVKPMLGRDFLPGEDQPGKAKIVMLSYGTWLKRFGGRNDVVGQSVTLSGDAYTIVGVLPREFGFAPRGAAEFWTPLLDKNNGCEQRRSCHNLDGIGRLRDGVTMQAAQQEMSAIAAQLAIQYPGSNQGQGADVSPLAELIQGDMRPMLLTLLGAAGLLLLIACVNVSSLLLVRSESRRREVAVRGALGATPIRLVRQFVTEGLLLSFAGCVVGVGFATWLMNLMKMLIPKVVAAGLPFLTGVGLNSHTFLFAGAIALLSAVLTAATPIVRLSFQDIREGLGDGGRAAAGRFWRRVGANLVVVELAIAMVLLVGAGLLGKSFYKLLHVETGIDISHLATVQVMAPQNIYAKDEQMVALIREVNRRMLALPGVQSVGMTTVLPVNCNCNTDWIRIVGKPFHGEHNEVDERDITPEYLATLKARMVRGRVFTEDDDASKSPKVIINEALAKKYFPGEDPIGQKIGNGALDPKSLREIVGVIADVREGALDADVWPAEYEPMYQGPSNYFTLVMRTAQDENSILPLMVKTLHDIDGNLGVFGELSMTDQIGSTQSALLHRVATWLVAGFATMALLLGVVGLYGVIAFSVSQRTREIGVRMALGAQRGEVYKMVMRQAGWLTMIGVAIGLVCAVGASMTMGKMLFGVAAWDAPTLVGVAVVLGGASLLASFLPARRAASVSPTDALRAE
jgi:macrolide transport system ATP-binding/permease protein